MCQEREAIPPFPPRMRIVVIPHSDPQGLNLCFVCLHAKIHVCWLVIRRKDDRFAAYSADLSAFLFPDDDAATGNVASIGQGADFINCHEAFHRDSAISTFASLLACFRRVIHPPLRTKEATDLNSGNRDHE